MVLLARIGARSPGTASGNCVDRLDAAAWSYGWVGWIRVGVD